MKATNFLESYLELQHTLQKKADFPTQFGIIQQWLETTLGVSELLFVSVPNQRVFSSLFALSKNGYSDRIIDFVKLLPLQSQVVMLPEPMQKLFSLMSENVDACVVFPVSVIRDRIENAVIAFVHKPTDFFQHHSTEMQLLCQKLHDLYMINEIASNKLLMDFNTAEAPEIEKARALIGLVHYPMFVSDLAGQVMAVNQELLKKCRVKSFFEVSDTINLFGNSSNKRAILNQLKKNEQNATRRITFETSNNQKMSVNLYATRHNDLIICSLFDIGEFVQITEELQSALDMQELLNDRLLDSNLVLQKTQSSAIRALARLAEFRDHETGEHLKRIGEYTRLLATEVYKQAPYSFKIRMEYPEEIFLSSMLHDIGKVAIPDTILHKPGVLSDEERTAMKNHTVYGWSILTQADQELGEQSFLTLAAQIALSHHERWDGSGYPNQLSGEKIPLSARISAVADVYDALTTERPYKKSWSHEKAVTEINQKCGIHFDPVLVNIMNTIEKKMLEIRYSFPG
ncbi:MAG: HD domain-containing protein [Spirochaetales bacterium]|nr:HD domain-containing protein [Spirochaetales bacterium]